MHAYPSGAGRGTGTGSGPLHCHRESKCRAIPERIELFWYQCKEEAAMPDRLSVRPDNLSVGGYYRGRVIVNAAPWPCSETTVREPR